MKRMLALLVALLLIALPALAEPMSYLDYTDDILGDGSPIYYFPELSMKLPADWQGRVMAMPGEGGTSFYQRASYEKYQAEGLEGGGFLFMLGVSVNGSFSQLPAFRYLGFSEASALNYYLQLPTDYPAYMNDESIRAEYDAMSAQIDQVVAGVSFYAAANGPDDGGTDPGSDMGQAEPTAAPEAPEAALTLERVRYHFEHSALPRFFYEAPENVIQVLYERGIYPVWTSLADENGVAYPYTADDYAVNRYDMDDGTTVLQAVMPRPEVSPQCFRVYFVYNPDRGIMGYYTIEYENLLGESALTCGWTEDRQHVEYGGAALLDPADPDYASALQAEAGEIAKLAGASVNPVADSEAPVETPYIPEDLAEIPCPQQGFAVMADPAFPWDYQEGTGVTIYTEEAGRIPYVIVFRSEDLLGEPFEYLKEQYTPHIQDKYGDDLVYYQEYENYSLGGKQLPAGVYTYRLQGHLIDLIRVYDSTGTQTVVYTAKYIQGQAEPTLSALHDAIRYFREG